MPTIQTDHHKDKLNWTIDQQQCHLSTLASMFSFAKLHMRQLALQRILILIDPGNELAGSIHVIGSYFTFSWSFLSLLISKAKKKNVE